MIGPAALLALGLLAAAPDLGRLELQRFELVYTRRAEGTAAMLSRGIEQERSELARRLGRDWEGRTTVFVGEGTEELAAIAPPGVEPPRWAAGMAFPQANALLFDARALRGDHGRQLLLHELAHLALGRAAPGNWPRWFQEGFAMLVAGEWSLARYAAIYRASLDSEAIPLSALERQWPERLSEVEVAYAQSFSFVGSLYEQDGEETFRRLIGAVAAGTPFDEAFAQAYGATVQERERAWRATLSSRYSWVPVVASQTTLWVLVTAVFVVAGLLVRGRRRRRLEAMELEEQAKEAALRIAAAEAAQAAAAARAAGVDGDDGEEPPGGAPPPSTLLN